MSIIASTDDISTRINIQLTHNVAGLNVIHVNACSLFRKLNYLRQLVENTPISVICVSETWFTDAHTWQMVCIKGFRIFRSDRNLGGKTGGGVAIYVREFLPAKVICKSKVNQKLEYILIELKINNELYLLGSVYNPPKNTEFNFLNETLDLYCDKYSDIIVTGDFNTNILKENFNSAQFIQMISSFGLNIVNNAPTHFLPKRNDQEGSSKSCLDLFIVSNLTKVVTFSQMPVSKLSHHDLILLAYSAPVHEDVHSETNYRNYKKVDMARLLKDCYSRDWAQIYLTSDVDKQMSFFV